MQVLNIDQAQEIPLIDGIASSSRGTRRLKLIFDTGCGTTQIDTALLENLGYSASIKKGGKSARSKVKSEKIQEKSICLRVPVDIAERIKDAVAGREVKTSANTWLVEAVISQLKKEKF